MLERISEIQGIGLLHQANGKLYTCQRATLIYADNGRGKSTLATTLRSVSTGNGTLISACRTIDGTLPPKVVLQFGSGHKVNFVNGVWSEKRPEVLVFDAEFIGRNVHSGGAVSTDHRKNLLEFALGEAAVTARTAVDAATAASKAASDLVTSLISQLSGHHPGMLLPQFEQLPNEPDIDTKVAELNKRILAASNVAAIKVKQIPKAAMEPSFDLDGLFAGLALSLKDVHADAEQIVKQHVARLGGKGAEGWLSQGLHFGDRLSCPFCDQDVSSNQLVGAYQAHFNAAYAALKRTVAGLQEMVANGMADGVIQSIGRSVDVAASQATAWAEHVHTENVRIDFETANSSLKILREFLLELTRKKQSEPLEALGSVEEKTKAVALWEQFLAPIREANVAIKMAEGLISTYKIDLDGENAAQLQQQVLRLQAINRRYAPQVVNLFVQLDTAQTDADNAEKTKKAARESLDGLMTSTLAKYQTSINALLKHFGASFCIEGMSANFRGKAPRSDYGLLLRGKEVALEGGTPSFATALSEGDKRTLAFAFFVASTLADPKLASRVIVIDDPMCSLDLNRRHHTRTVLRKIHAKAEQLIVLAHDPYFLRDLRDALNKDDSTAPVAMFQLTAAPHNYTDFASLDIDRECESDYVKHHRLLNNFSTGNGGDPAMVAKAVRPMLEAYLHRRFPGLVPKNFMFGEVVAYIRGSTAPSPLCHAANLVDELTEINDYVRQFHHKDAATISVPELKTFVDRALCVVHKSSPA